MTKNFTEYIAKFLKTIIGNRRYSQLLVQRKKTRSKFEREKLLKSDFLGKFFIFFQFYRYHLIARKLRKKEKINVVFLAVFDSAWKYDYLYHLMEKDERFHPTIVVIPYTSYGEETMYDTLNKTHNFFKSKDYNVFDASQGNGNWIDVKTEFNPDIVFFCVPYDYTLPQYTIYNFLNCLTCYVPYAFVVINSLEMHYSSDFFSYLWRYYCESEYHVSFGKKLMINKAKNMKITGYPSLDMLTIKPKDVKIKNKKIIIWAPHHTVDDAGGELDYSCFEEYSLEILILAKKYEDKIEFVFKPHPLLRIKLNHHKNWGLEKTNRYYERWQNLPNGWVEEGDYLDLFSISDALVHDSASFMAEYLSTSKPLAFMFKDENIPKRVNEFGNKLLDLHYKIKNLNDLEIFINSVVLDNADVEKERRLAFIKKHFESDDHLLPSERILNDIKLQIK